MIRRISLLFLLATVSGVFAQPLYKWTESDGSITFSPTPPAGGISFEKLGEASPVAITPAADLPAAAPTSSPPGKALPRMEYAPGNAGDLPEKISRSPASIPVQPVNTGVAVSSPRLPEPADSGIDRADSNNAASNKQSRCQDLMKRVTSLERRLKSRLTPEDMDNTVLHMARYQRSYDQYCSQ